MNMKTMTREEWNQKGTELFGPDQFKWRFICPACKHIASVQDYKDAGATQTAVAFSCVGRWAGAKRDMFGKGEGPCNYAGGGLIGLNPVEIDGGRYFDFAPVEEVAAA